MPAQALIISETNMMNDQDETLEMSGERGCIRDERNHSGIVFLAAAKALGQSIDRDYTRPGDPARLDAGNEFWAPRKISPYGVMTGVRVRSAVDRSILGLSSRLPEVAAGFSCWGVQKVHSL
jgi:hypothetical protein